MQSNFSHIIFILLLSATSFNNLYAQNEPIIRTKHLDYKDGLVGRRATAVLQDSDGFMWIATVDALNRYDGHTFKHFDQSNSELNYREVNKTSICEDTEGYLWLKYADDIEFIHHRTFEVLTLEERFGAVDFKPDAVQYIEQNEHGVILIQLKSKKLYLYSNKRIMPLPFFVNEPNRWLRENDIVAFKNNQLTIYDFNGNVKSTINISARPFHLTDAGLIYANKYDKATHAYNILSCQNGNCQVIAKLPLQKDDTHFHRWRFKYDKRSNRFIVFNSLEIHRDIYSIDIETGQYYPTNIEGNKLFLGHDQNDIIWLGNKDGVTLVKYHKSSFDYYKDVVNARGIWANREKMIVASSHAADYIYDIDNTLSKVKFSPPIHTIVNDKNEFWGGNNGHFAKIDVNTETILQKIHLKKAHYSSIWASLKDKNNNWWLSHQFDNRTNDILFYNSTQDDSTTIFNQYNEFEDVKNAHVIHFLEDENLVWASSNKGLIAIDKQKGIIGVYKKTAKKGFQLPFKDVYWLYKDANNIYWAATNQSGLVKFTLDKSLRIQSFKQYTTDNYLSSNVIYSIFEDEYKRLWLSTLSGITCLDKSTETVRVFTDIYGALPINEFNRTSGFQAIDGRIYFGSVKGVIGFHPNDIDTAKYNKPLILSDIQFYIGKKEEQTNQRLDVLNNNRIVIQPNVQYAKIEVALVDYFDVKAAQYFYKIEGLHDDFRQMDGNAVLLNNLPYGKYTIRFKAQNQDKRFSTNEISWPLTVVRPFYLRWWFILLVIAAIVGLFWLFYNWRVAQLKKRQTELEEMVSQRTEQIRKDKQVIEEQAEELKALDKLKDRFFANISHELRTPLTLILGPLKSALKDKTLSNKTFTSLSVVKRHANYLLKRINEIMELNRLEVKKGQLNEQPVLLYDFLKVLISNFESIAPQKQITFTYDYQLSKSLKILLDKDKFEHIIYNYLSNAFKYTSKNGAVNVVLTGKDNLLRLAVKDTGIGIPKHDIPNLFQRFYQAENAQKAGSSGIGLALCREIAELLNGKVWVESEIGKGSTFFFEMPFVETLGIIEKDENDTVGLLNFESLVNLKPSNGNKKHTILLTEDNHELRSYIASILSEYYNVHTAENGQEALNWLAENAEPNLIVSDIMMPIMDGFELLEIIKKSDKYRHIPMIMLTARQSVEAKLSALQLGVDDYLTKPFNEQELLIRIQNLLQNQEERLAFIQEENGTLNQDSSNKTAQLQLSATEQEWLTTLEEIVQNNLNNSSFSVGDCAEIFFISERQLQRKVKKTTGLSLNKYLRLVRLKKARLLFETGEMKTISEVAYAVGFETPAYFSKVFYQEFGKKPMEYLQ